MNVRIALLLVAAWVAATLHKLAASLSEIPCPSINSCQNRTDFLPSKAPFHCRCDALCNTYGDCCLDAENRDASRQETVQHDFWCKRLDKETSVYVTQPKCKEGWADKEVEDLCLGFNMLNDRLSSILVTSKNTNITYRNYYCAICNEDVQDLRMWNGKLSCRLPKDAQVNLTDLIFVEGDWGVFYGSPEEERFRWCGLTSERPQGVKNLTRTCLPSSGWDPPHFYKSYTYTQTLDFTSLSINVGVSAEPCSPTQVWDPFLFRRCRSVVCPKPQQDFINGTCEDVAHVDTVTSTSPMSVCPSKSSCQLRIRDSDACHCDELCNTYADCCLDAEYRDARKQKLTKYNEFKCEHFPIHDPGGHFLVKPRVCKEGWSDKEVEDLCLSNDLISDLVVTSNTTSITYPNYYCAVCNDDVLDLIAWKAVLTCDTPQDSEEDLTDTLIRNISWGSFHGRSTGAFPNCSFIQSYPGNTESMRRCEPLTTPITTCHDDWQNEAVASLCQAYTDRAYFSKKLYRNPYCALCNYETDDYTCSEVAAYRPKAHPVPFAYLVDFLDPYNNVVGSASLCSHTQFWDPFFRRCRNVVCPPRQHYRYGECEEVSDDDLVTSTDQATASTPPVSPALATPSTQVLPKPSCPRNSCQGGNVPHSADEAQFSCQCDALCNTYADCCLDSEYIGDSKQKTEQHNEFLCKPLGGETFRSYMKKPGCKEGWEDKEVEDLCVSNGKDTDPLSSVLVTSRTTGITYQNYYCAICNEDIRDLRMWNGKLSCDLPQDAQVNLEDVIPVDDGWRGSLGTFYENSNEEHFGKCRFSSERPADIAYLTRLCPPPSMIKTCRDGWQDEEVASRCQSYTDVVYYEDWKAYRNLDCARCNNESDEYSCVPQILGGLIGELIHRSNNVSYTQTLDFTNNTLSDSSLSCSPTQVWDPFRKRCRSILCPNPDQKYRDGRCENEGHLNLGTNSNSSNLTIKSEMSNKAILGKKSTEKKNEFTTTPASPADDKTPTPGPPSSSLPAIPTPTPSHFLDTDTSSATATVSVPPAEDNVAILASPNSRSPASSPPSSSHLPDPNASSATDAPIPVNFSSEFAECPRVVLSEGEFVLLDNGSVYVEAYNRFYSPGEDAEWREEDLVVCPPDSSTSSPKFSAVLGWVSVAGLGLSCVALLLHLAAFALLPELKNLAGKNLASLCLALLAAYVTFLANTLGPRGPAGCVTLAAAMYYFFVASFTWMNAIAFDVWRTFRLSQRQLRVSSGAQWQRFLAYSLYSWLLPAAATLVLLLVDQLEPLSVPDDFLPRLGRTWCWFSHRKALLSFFAAPTMAIIVVNGVLFVHTAFIIAHTGSTAAASSASGGYHQGQYKLYLRLAALMGFTWLSGIAAGYFRVEALWYVFVLLNTLQGVFIFLAFTVRTNVWQGVGAATRTLIQRSLSRVIRRPPPPNNHAFELYHTSTHASCSTLNTQNDC